MGAFLLDHFNDFAPSYDRVNLIVSLRRNIFWRQRLMEAAARFPAHLLLDLCAGTLDCTLDFLKFMPEAEIVAVDFCRAMLDMGESKLSDDLKPRVTLKCADVLQLELRQHSFDLVVSSFGMRHIRERELIVKKIGTWLIPRGRLIVLDFF